MPRRTTPHSIVDYTNDEPSFHESNLVDDDHYISLQLHSDLDNNDDEEHFEPRPSRNTPLTGVQRLEISASNFVNPRQQNNMSAEYERFDIRAPIWGPNKRQSIILSACGAISIICGVLCCVCGVFDFIIESYAGEAAFQVESKFGMLVIVFGGLASCKAASRLRATSLACLLGFSLMGVGAGLCDATMQCLNQYYVKDPLERGIDIAILLFSFVGAVSSLIQAAVAILITSSVIERQSIDSGYSTALIEQKHRALILGLIQSICGAVITALTVGVYAVLDNEAVLVEWKQPIRINGTNTTAFPYQQWSQNVKWTLSSEMTGHGFLIAVAGLSVAISTVHWTKWTQLVTLSLQAAALVIAACNHVHPLANIYTAPSYLSPDVKLSIVQLFIYLFVVIIAAVTFGNALERLRTASNISRSESSHQTVLNSAIKDLAEKRGWRLYQHTALIQLSLASLYFLVWIVGFGEKLLYLLDFTPLPILVLLHAVLSYSLTLSYSALMLMLNVAWVFLCGLYAVRDLYLFDYHAATKVPQDQLWLPKYQNESFTAALPMISKLGIHLLLTAAALMETVLSGTLLLMYLRTLGDTMGIVIPNKLQHKHTLRALSVIGGLQLASAALIVNFGFILFLSNFFTVEYLGDVCTFLGLLLLGTGACTFLIARAPAVFLPLAAIMNALTFVVLWQHTDGNGLLFSRIILYYKDNAGSEQHRAYVFSAITFALCLTCQVLSGLSLIGLEDVLIDAKFDSCVRVEMMVQNAAALENIDLVHNANA